MGKATERCQGTWTVGYSSGRGVWWEMGVWNCLYAPLLKCPLNWVVVTTLQRTVLMEVWGTRRRERLEDEEEGTFVPERYIPAIWGILNVTEQGTLRKVLGILNRNQGLFRRQQKIFLTLNTHHSRYHRDQTQ